MHPHRVAGQPETGYIFLGRAMPLTLNPDLPGASGDVREPGTTAGHGRAQ